MRDSFTRDNARDFQARYLGSYGHYIRDDGKSIPVFLSNMDDNTLYFTDLYGVEFNTVVNSGAVFEFMQMTRRLYAGLDGNIYLIERRPARQWTRGVSQNNTRAWLLTEKHGAVERGVEHTLMRNILVEMETKGKTNFKLTDQIAIVGSCLYLYNLVIGGYHKETNTVELARQYDVFSVEVKDACRPFNIGVKNA
jgi:hypothetical protein